MNNNRWIYLVSSNATKEYLLDILEVLSLPSGFVQHFRYRLKWLDEELRSKLPIKGEGQNCELKNSKMVICYLYQKEIKSKRKWVAVYPIRSSILMDAYKTGDSDLDIAHFYFKVEDYISYNGQDFTGVLKEIAKEKFGKTFAFLCPSFNNCLSNKKVNNSAFHNICASLPFKHLKSLKGNTTYFPLYCFIEGLKNRKGKPLVPVYDSLTRKSSYEIDEGARYSFVFSTYLIETHQSAPNFSVKLLSNEKIFSTPSEYELKASSHYDEESWTIISSLLERDIHTSISFKTELPNKIDNKESLNLYINFPVKVKRRCFYRTIDFLGDIGFAAGTGSLALKGFLPDWGLAAGGSYLIWIICKFIVKNFRG